MSGARDHLLEAVDRPRPLALERLRDTFGLTEFECRMVMLSFAYEADTGVTQAVDAATGDSGASGIPIWLFNDLFDEQDWAASSPSASLRRWRILRAHGPATRARTQLRLAEAVTDAMTGTFAIDEILVPIMSPLIGDRAPDPDDMALIAEPLSQRNDAGLSPVPIAPWTLGCERVAACLRAMHIMPYRLDPARLAARIEAVDELQRTLERDVALRPLALVAETPADMGQQEALAAFLDGLGVHGVLVGEHTPSGMRRPTHRLERRIFAPGDAARLWKDGLGPRAAKLLNGSVERAATHFDLDAHAIAQAANAVRQSVEASTTQIEASTLFWAAAARAAWPEPGNLARVVEPRATFDDLVVSTELRSELDAIVRQVRHAATVFGDWNFDHHTARGRGAAALFSGPSGTGKTLAAEVIANELALPLVIADFSQLQSKWVGETPKLAAKLFDDLDRGGAVLLMDEVEGMLGRRSGMGDGRDRLANGEVGYFLQRLEAFRGLAILTTNMKHAVDEAFLRRFRFALDFNAPDLAARLELWRRAFPEAAPVGTLDIEALARFSLTGGAIRNIALNAAFLAAEDGGRIERRHVARALRTEFRKLERPLSELDIGGYA